MSEMEHRFANFAFVMDLYPSRLSFTGPSELAVKYFVMDAMLEHNASAKMIDIVLYYPHSYNT